MRKTAVVALTLVLALSACSPESSSLTAGAAPEDPTPEGPTPEDPPPDPPPEPPPGDALVLIVDGTSHQGRLAEPDEVHWYRFEARAGQDYLIFARPRRGPTVGGAETAISLHDTAGAAIEVADQSDSGRIDWRLLRDAEAATYHIRVVSGWPEHTGQYAVAVRAVDDGHGDTAAEGPEIEFGGATELAGTFDYWGDTDWFVFEAQGGETFRIRAGSASPQFYRLSPADEAAQGGGGESAGPRLERWGTGGFWDTLQLKPWHLAESGRYGLRLVGSVDSQGFPQPYTVTFELLTDDHANIPPAATSLGVGRTVAGSLDYSYDEDWFSVDLAAPQKYLVEVLSAAGEPILADVSLYGAASTESYRSNLSLQQDELVASPFGRVLWQARESGAHLIQLAEDESLAPEYLPADYLIRVSRAPADDHADGPQGATRLAVGEWVEGTIDELTDTDWFGFGARRGVVYTVEHEEFDESSGGYLAIDEDYPWPEVSLSFVASGRHIEASRGVVAETAGDLALRVSQRRSGARYRLRVVAHEREDYSDGRAGAAAIAITDAVRGSASDQDVDWFVLDTPASGIYFAGARTSQPGAFSVAVFDEDGEVDSLYAGTRFGRDPSRSRSSELWRAAAGDRYWIRVAGKWPRLFHYRLVLDYSDAADDHGNSAEDATVVVFDPASVPAGVDELEHRRGRSAAEVGVPQVTIEGAIGKYVDEDWFALHLERGVKYLIHPYVPAGTAAGRPIFDEDGRLNLRDGDEYLDSWSRQGPPIGFVPTVSGTYHVQIEDYLGSPHSGPWAYGFEVAILEPDAISDTRRGASLISSGETVEGVLDTHGDLDWYLLDAVEGQTWLLESPSDRWGCVEVHGPDGTGVLAQACLESRLVWSVPATGRYAIRTSGHWAIRYPPSDYRFTLSVLDPDDHGNDPARASALVPGRAQGGGLDYFGDVDVFRLPVAAGDVWVLTGTRSHYGTDFLAEFGPEDGDVGSARSLRIDEDGAYLPARVAGVWLISVSGEDSLGEYTLTATRWDVPDDYGDSRREAHPIAAPERPESECEEDPGAAGCPAGTTVTGSLEYPGDSDYFRLHLVAGRKYALSVDGLAGLAVLGEADCVPGVRGTWEVESSGGYWVRVGGAGSTESPQDYVLSITRLDDDWEDPWVDPWDLATQLELGEVHEDTLTEPGERHYFRVRLDHPNYLLELHGDVWDRARSPEHRGTAYSPEGSRLISQLPYVPPVVYEFAVVGSGEYSVVVREWSRADELLGWNSRHGSAVSVARPAYCAAEAG